MNGFVMCPKYVTLNEAMGIYNIPDTTDKMAFINFDCILNAMIDQWADIGFMSVQNKFKVTESVVQFVGEVVSHFKQYFVDHTLILYYTDINSSSQMFKTGMANGNEYRLNYLSRMDSIKYRDFKTLWNDSVLNIIQMIIDSIPNVYLIRTMNIDSSLVPMVFAKEYPDRKMIVMTWDHVDCLLTWLCPNIVVLYDARGKRGVNPVMTNGRNYIDTVTNAINPNHYGLFATKVLMAAVGSYTRSLYGIGKSPAGYDVIGQWLSNAFENSSIPDLYNDFTIISKSIPNNIRDDFEESYRGMDLEYQYQALTTDQKAEILYKMDHNPIDPKEVIKMFPGINLDWNRVYN